jgi:hypothetical protein
LTTQLQNEEEEEEEQELRGLMIKCTRVFLLYRRRVGLEVLPCFEVPVLEVLEGTIGRVIGTEKQREGPRTLPFSGVRTCPNFQRKCTSTHREDFLPFHKILDDHSLAEFLHLTMVI